MLVMLEHQIEQLLKRMDELLKQMDELRKEREEMHKERERNYQREWCMVPMFMWTLMNAEKERAAPLDMVVGIDGADYFSALRKTEGESRRLGVWRGKGTTFRNSGLKGRRSSLQLLSVSRPTTRAFRHCSYEYARSNTFDTGVSMADFAIGDGDDYFKSVSGGRPQYVPTFHNYIQFPSMNKDGRWESFIAELEENAVRVRRGVRQGTSWPRDPCTEYTLPIVGTMRFCDPSRIPADAHPKQQTQLLPKVAEHCRQEQNSPAVIRKVRARPSRYFFWRGHFLDNEMAYERVFDADAATSRGAFNFTFRPLYSLSIEVPSFVSGSKDGASRTKKHAISQLQPRMYRDSKQRTLQPQAVSIVHNDAHHCNSLHDVCDAGEFLEIDLGKPTHVTHLGTMGRELDMSSFYHSCGVNDDEREVAFWDSQEAQAAHLLGNGAARGLARSICVIPDNATSGGVWVTQYELSFRHPTSHKWTVLARAVDANTNVHSEHIFDLANHFTSKHGVFTQFLRLRPLAFHNNVKCTVRVAVYGPTASAPDIADNSESVVVYRISQGDNAVKRRVRDGQIDSCKWESRFGKREAKKSEFRRLMARFHRGAENDA